LKPGITNPEEFPPLNDPIWENITLWPKTINKGRFEYQIECHGKNIDNEQIVVSGSDLKEIDTNFHYYAYYQPTFIPGHKFKREDCDYGPNFGWRPDGSIYAKGMYDENQNHEFYYFYINGQIAYQLTFALKNNNYREAWFDEFGNIVGERTIQYEGRWYKTKREYCQWQGKSCPDCIHANFIKENKHKIW